MARTKLQIKNEKKELKQEIFDLGHPRNVKGQFVSKYDAPRNLRYWKKKWGRKYGITTPEQGEAVEAMEQGLDQEEAEPKKKSIIDLLKP
jgi:transposase-like protein